MDKLSMHKNELCSKNDTFSNLDFPSLQIRDHKKENYQLFAQLEKEKTKSDAN